MKAIKNHINHEIFKNLMKFIKNHMKSSNLIKNIRKTIKSNKLIWTAAAPSQKKCGYCRLLKLLKEAATADC